MSMAAADQVPVFNALVVGVHFPEEFHGAGLRHFDSSALAALVEWKPVKNAIGQLVEPAAAYHSPRLQSLCPHPSRLLAWV